jgi:hypothetical protein
MSPSTTCFVPGSKGLWPAVYRNPPAMIARDHGPMAAGAASLLTTRGLTLGS